MGSDASRRSAPAASAPPGGRDEGPPPLVAALDLLWGEPDGGISRIRRSGDAPPAPAGERDRSDGRTPGAGSDAVVIEGSASMSPDAVVSLVEELAARRSAPPEHLCVVFDRGWVRGGWWDLLRGAVRTPPPVARTADALERWSYRCHAVLHGTDRAELARSFFSRESGLFTLPHTAHPLRRLTESLGTDHLKHASALLLVGRAGGSGPLPALATMEEGVPGREGLARGEDLRLLGFQIRPRGTLIAFARSRTSPRRIVGKFSLAAAADEPLHDSFRLQEWLREEALAGSTRSAIPRPLSYVERSSGTGRPVFLEDMSPGVVAWKVDVGERGARIEADAFRFLEDLQEQTRQPGTPDSGFLEDLLDPAVRRAESAGCAGADLAEALRRLARCILGFHRGKTVGFVASHGDFGIGNVLVDESTGALSAVVDWADGRRVDFPTVDPVNWLIQRTRARERLSFVDAVAALEEAFTLGHVPIESTYLVEGRSLSERGLAALHTAVFRYVERSLKYPVDFASECGPEQAVAELVEELADRWEERQAVGTVS